MSPEEIVAIIGNIANRPDIREAQAKQIGEIKEYAANLFDGLANDMNDILVQKMDPTSSVDVLMYAIVKRLRYRAMEIRTDRS